MRRASTLVSRLAGSGAGRTPLARQSGEAAGRCALPGRAHFPVSGILESEGGASKLYGCVNSALRLAIPGDDKG